MGRRSIHRKTPVLKRLAKDQLRDTWLRDQGLTVLRYPNSAVNSGLEGVCRDIPDHLPGIRAPVIE